MSPAPPGGEVLTVAWHRAVELTRRRAPESFDRWLSGVQIDGFSDGCLCLAARNDYTREHVAAHYLPELLSHIHLELTDGAPLQVRWRIDPNLDRPVGRAPASRRPEPAPRSSPRTLPPPSTDRAPASASSASVQAGIRARLNAKYTFANFVVGPTNALAHGAAVAAASTSGPRYNPLFIAGGTGLGKTHLMHAIAHKMLEENADARIVYVSAEHFTNDFIEGLKDRRMEEFRMRYREECDLLLVDDIQFLAGREQTQEEFFHTFNALRDTNVPIVVTSDKYPQQLERMPERLVSRFSSGLVADIHVPQLETRVAIVRKKAQLENIPIEDAVAVMLAQAIQTNVRELEGALIRLAAKASLEDRSFIDRAFAEKELAIVAPRRKSLGLEDVQRAVCTHFRITSYDLVGKSRRRSIAFARQVAMYVCRKQLHMSFPELGTAFQRDHTTALSAVNKIQHLLEGSDQEVIAHVSAIERQLASNDE